MRTLIATLCLAVAPMAMAANKHVHQAVALNPDGTLSLSTHNGSITVTGSNEAGADIDAVIEPGEMGYAEDVQKTEIRISGSGSGVRVESDYSAVGTHIGWLGLGTNRVYPLVHYTIRMPAGARLEIEDHNAKTRVTGLRGDIQINSHNGPVEIADFTGGASVETHNGDVRVAYSRFTKESSFETHKDRKSVV